MFGRRVNTILHTRDHDDIVFEGQERKHLAALKFDEWVMFKDRFDRGLELFAKLDSTHCRVAMFFWLYCCTDRYLDVNPSSAGGCFGTKTEKAI